MVLIDVTSIKGKRDYMEDHYSHIKSGDYEVAMICDGHGGKKTSKETCSDLPERLMEIIKKEYKNNLILALNIRREIIKWADIVKDNSCGSTLTGIAATPYTVFVYNIGDSKTYVELKKQTHVIKLDPLFDINGNFMDVDNITSDFADFCNVEIHNPLLKKEKIRVSSCGGHIKGDRLNGTLAMTRALGDKDVGKGLCSIPDIYWFNRKRVKGNIFLFSDGLYEPWEAHPDIEKYLKDVAISSGTKRVTRLAEEYGSQDNITAMLVSL